MAPTSKRVLFIVVVPMVFFVLRNLSMLKLVHHESQKLDPSIYPLESLEKVTMDVYDEGIIGSPNSTLIEIGHCSCELVSIDCLHTIECLPDPGTSWKNIQEGTIKRRALQKTAIFWDAVIKDDYDWAPLGKSMQATSIKLWREWMLTNHLPLGFFSRNESFVNETFYPFCLQNRLRGRACFFREFGARELFGQLELEAIKRHGKGNDNDVARAKEQLQSLRDNPYNVTSYSYLLHFSHMSRIALNMRDFLIETHNKRLRVIRSKDAHSNVLSVSIHVRRGDACQHALSGYSRKASRLDSEAQMSVERLCYDTSVYITALQKVRSLTIGRHIEVYIATDHMTDLLAEIKRDYRPIYDAVTWKYVDYSRTLFNYSQGMTEGENYIEWSVNMAQLGETAVVDIWHLSHGQVFIGHLGSRFGKLSWWQAIARHNSFVPFFTVDGHSVCCDIDEACGRVSPAIVSMENCLVFARDESEYLNDPEVYWSEGSMVRFQAADFELKHRRERLQSSANSSTSESVPNPALK